MKMRKLKYKVDVEGFEEIKKELKDINESIEKTIIKTKTLKSEVDKLKEENKNLSEENRFLKNALRELSQIVYGDRERIV